jgi:hypothetical protein
VADDSLADQLEGLRSYIDNEVKAGFSPVGEIPENAVSVVAEDGDADLLMPYAEKFTAEALVALAEAEKSWPAVTDCDRIDAAFRDLESSGIVARQNFTCCQTCGHAEIWDEMKSVADSGQSVTGYAFYHWQDTEAAVDGDGLRFAYGSTDERESAAVAVGNAIADALRRQGLKVTWDGTFKKRISAAIDWKRRRA